MTGGISPVRRGSRRGSALGSSMGARPVSKEAASKLHLHGKHKEVINRFLSLKEKNLQAQS